MNEFVKILLSLSVSGTLLFLLIWGLKPLYKRSFSRCWQYYIWLMVALRFLLPFTPDTTIVGSLFEKFDTAAITNEVPASPNVPVPVNPGSSHAEPIQANREITDTAMGEPFPIYVCLFFIWSALALVLFIRKITVYQGFVQYIKAENKEVSDIKILNLLSDCEEKLNINTSVELSCNPLIASPMLIGFFRPKILLPARELEEKELSYIFMHELTHYKQRDMFYKWLIQIVVCVHWFNPFVYLLEKEVNQSCELSCDEKVISILDEKAKREYGDTLISFLKSDNPYKNSSASVTLTEGAEQLKERLGAIMKFRKKSKVITAITAVFTVTICVCFFVTGAYAAPSVASDVTTWKDSEIQNEAFTKDRTGKGYEYTYTQKGYYCNSYIIEMGWNLYKKDQEHYTAIDIDFADNAKMTVYFSDSAKAYRNDRGAVSAIEELIYSLKSATMSPEIEMPLIQSITPAAADELPALAEQYYQTEDWMRFSALFSVLDKAAQENYCQKAYDTGKIALFSTMIQDMDADFILQYVNKSEQDKKTNFFAVLLDSMSSGDLKQYAEKYYEADNIARFTILVDHMTREEKQEWLERAQADKKTNFAAVLSDNKKPLPNKETEKTTERNQPL